jgi:hypothetical protein
VQLVKEADGLSKAEIGDYVERQTVSGLQDSLFAHPPLRMSKASGNEKHKGLDVDSIVSIEQALSRAEPLLRWILTLTKLYVKHAA